MFGKLIRALYYILFFTVPLIVIPSTSELFELNKMTVIYSAALLVFCFGAADAVLGRRSFISKTPMNIPFAVFLSVLILSFLFSIDRHTSFFGYYGRFNGGVLSILSYLVLFYGIVKYFRKEDVLRLLKVSVATSVVVMIWGLSGKLGRDFSCLIFTGTFDNSCWTDQFRPAERMFSTLGQPNWLGAYLASHFFIGLYFYARQTKNKFKSWFVNVPYGVYLVLTFMCILFTRSRSALVAWGAGVIIFTLYHLVKHKKKSLTPYLGIAAACVVAVLLFKTGVERIDKFIRLPQNKAPAAAPSQVAQPQLSSEVTESFDIRKIVWTGAWELGKKYPVLGTGPETFGYSYYFVRPQEHNMTSEWDYIYNKAHNEFLNYLATTGFAGLASYLVVIGSVIVMLSRAIRRRHGDAKTSKKSYADPDDSNTPLFYLCVLCSFVTVLITNFFGFSTSTSQLAFYLWPALAVVAGGYATASAHSGSRAPRGFWEYAALGSIVLTGVLSLIWIVLFFTSDLKYARGVARLSQGEYQGAALDITEALTFHYEHVYEDRLSTALANVALLAAFGDKPELTGRFIARAEQYIDHAISQSPQNMLYWKTKGKNEYTFYQANPDDKYIDGAISSLTTAYQLAPTEPKLPYTLGLLYGAKNEKEQSIKLLDTTIALKPDYREAYILKLKLLRAWKETDRADAFQQEVFKLFPGITEKELQEVTE